MSEPLDNLVKIGKLKAEPYAKSEFDGMVESAGKSLKDSRKTDLDPESQFHLAYRASHLYALAALRAAGYRSQDRITVFQTLVQPGGAKLWQLVYQFQGKQRQMALGPFPEVSLAVKPL